MKTGKLMRNFINTLANWACHTAKAICLLCMLLLTPIIFVNIITRFVFGYSIAWSSEVARYSFIWMTFMGMAVALKDDSHAKIDLLIKKAPLPLRKWILTAGHMIIVILSIFLIVAGFKQTVSVWNVEAAYMRFLSMSWMYLSIPISGVFMMLFSISGLMDLLANQNHASGESK